MQGFLDNQDFPFMCHITYIIMGSRIPFSNIYTLSYASKTVLFFYSPSRLFILGGKHNAKHICPIQYPRVGLTNINLPPSPPLVSLPLGHIYIRYIAATITTGYYPYNIQAIRTVRVDSRPHIYRFLGSHRTPPMWETLDFGSSKEREKITEGESKILSYNAFFLV